MSDDTPLMRQYLGIKEDHQDAILFFRLGDFYEMFFEDAEIASRVLGIVLTTRDKNKDNPVPMCGIPYHSSEGYVTKLIRAGYKVAVCEQMGDPAMTKGIVERKVVRIITPGTHTPESPKHHNYILAFVPEGRIHGIALADITTGEFLLFETQKEIRDELGRFEPREVLMPTHLKGDLHYNEATSDFYVTYTVDWPHDFEEAYRGLLEYFGVASLEGYGIEGMKAAIQAAWALLSYLVRSQKDSLSITRMARYHESGFMMLDSTTQNNLELVRNIRDGSRAGALLSVLDYTHTPMGGRFMRGAILRPLLDKAGIEARLEAVRYLVEDFELLDLIRSSLSYVHDLERLTHRVQAGTANARDLAAIKQSLAYIPRIKHALTSANNHMLRIGLGEPLDELNDIYDLIGSAIVEHPPVGIRDGGIIKQGYSDEVDELRNISVNARDIIASLQARERTRTGIGSLKVGYNKVFGYFIEVTKANLAQVPDDYVRKQTLAGGERFVTPELKDYEARVLGAEDRLKPLEHEIFMRVMALVAEAAMELRRDADCLGALDFLGSLALVAKRHNYVQPSIRDDEGIMISEGRHPVLERMTGSSAFIPNDTRLDGLSNRILLLTGPNMAGKSTYMRQVALIVLMAQTGSFVPAEQCSIGIVDRIFTRIGATDFIAKGQSTFMVEMIETANILNNATRRSLIILDEVGRGTSTFDGISIAWATAEHIANRLRSITLFATHYQELTDLVHSIPGIRNANIQVKEIGDQIIFLHRIADGPADRSYGIHVARLAGLPETVLERSRQILCRLEEQALQRGTIVNARQMSLFEPVEQAIMRELLASSPDRMDPEEARAFLATLRRKAEG